MQLPDLPELQVFDALRPFDSCERPDPPELDIERPEIAQGGKIFQVASRDRPQRQILELLKLAQDLDAPAVTFEIENSKRTEPFERCQTRLLRSSGTKRQPRHRDRDPIEDTEVLELVDTERQRFEVWHPGDGLDVSCSEQRVGCEPANVRHSAREARSE